MIFKWSFFAFSFLLLLQACSRNMPANPTTPGSPVSPDSTKKTDTSATPFISGSWTCQIDGVTYSGAFDTCFTRIDTVWGPALDTTVTCVGTTPDKRANIQISLRFNRTFYKTAKAGGLFAFDTCSDNVLEHFSEPQTQMNFVLDSVSSTQIQSHFDGTAASYPANGVISHTITNGKLVVGFHGGDHDPNSFHYSSTTGAVNGYFNEARLISNSLVLDGRQFDGVPQNKFRLIIRIGGTIKPGVYNSQDGNAGLQLYIPGAYHNYITDAQGQLTVTINSVTGNVVNGSFSGVDRYGSSIASGSFAVRIKNYSPEADSTNKWAFGEDELTFSYRTFAGNVLNGTLSQSTGRYFLTVNGESDHGASTFKLVLSSNTPIKKGIYQTGFFTSDKVDSLYFISPEKIWNGNNTYLFAGDYSQTIVQIDSINNRYAAGQLTGAINIFLANSSFARTNIREGRFTTSF